MSWANDAPDSVFKLSPFLTFKFSANDLIGAVLINWIGFLNSPPGINFAISGSKLTGSEKNSFKGAYKSSDVFFHWAKDCSAKDLIAAPDSDVAGSAKASKFPIILLTDSFILALDFSTSLEDWLNDLFILSLTAFPTWTSPPASVKPNLFNSSILTAYPADKSLVDLYTFFKSVKSKFVSWSVLPL